MSMMTPSGPDIVGRLAKEHKQIAKHLQAHQEALVGMDWAVALAEFEDFSPAQAAYELRR